MLYYLSLYIFLCLSSRLSTYRTHRDCHCIIHIFFLIWTRSSSSLFLLCTYLLLFSSVLHTLQLLISIHHRVQLFNSFLQCAQSLIFEITLLNNSLFFGLLATIYIYIFQLILILSVHYRNGYGCFMYHLIANEKQLTDF